MEDGVDSEEGFEVVKEVLQANLKSEKITEENVQINQKGGEMLVDTAKDEIDCEQDNPVENVDIRMVQTDSVNVENKEE